MLITLEQVSSFVFENFSNVKVSKHGTHFLAKCILCGDSKKRLSKRRFNLDYNNGDPIYHCFNCNRSGNFIQLYAQVKNISFEEARKEFSRFDKDSIKKTFKKKPFQKIKKNPIDVKFYDFILNDCVSVDEKVDGIVKLSYQKALKHFIKERNIYDYKLYIAYQGRYKGRVIIPIIEDGHIIFFQGRTVTNDPKKYDNPPSEKGHIILNKEKFDYDDYIIVTEGIFDALTIGNQGTSCLGASISDDFLENLYKYTSVGIIIALDNDERGIEETQKIIEHSVFSRRLKYFLMPDNFKEYKDINMLEGKVKDVYKFITKNSHNKFQYTVELNLRRKK